MTTIAPGHWRRAREERERVWRLEHPHEASYPSIDDDAPRILFRCDDKSGALLEGSIPDHAAPCTMAAPIARPSLSAQRLSRQARCSKLHQIRLKMGQSDLPARAAEGYITPQNPTSQVSVPNSIEGRRAGSETACQHGGLPIKGPEIPKPSSTKHRTATASYSSSALTLVENSECGGGIGSLNE